MLALHRDDNSLKIHSSSSCETTVKCLRLGARITHFLTLAPPSMETLISFRDSSNGDVSMISSSWSSPYSCNQTNTSDSLLSSGKATKPVGRSGMEQPKRVSEVSRPQEKTEEGTAGKLPLLKLRLRISTLRRERTQSQSWMRPV